MSIADDYTLEWMWAYRQSLWLLDQYDAEGLHCAEADETVWGSASWNGFLNTYGLKQGLHAGLRNKSEEVFNALVPIFKAPLPDKNPMGELTNRWLEGVSRVGKLVKKTKHGVEPKLISMPSKLLWFYHPKTMTIYDTYAARGLSFVTGSKVEPQHFLRMFEQIFAEKMSAIAIAETLSDRTYPYPRRVLDQWLWLKGNDSSKAVLRRFKLSFDRAPIRAAARGVN